MNPASGPRPTPIASLRAPTLSDRALTELRAQLARGRFAPGERVGVDRLAAEFDISPLPVREALRVLLAEGRVEYSPHRGYRVAKLSLADVEENFLICRLLEGEALRRGVPAMTDEAIAHMGRLLETLEHPPDDTALWEHVALHQDFHFVPIEHAGLPRLVAELRRLWDHTDHYRALYFFRDEVARHALQREHREIFHACSERDAERVNELMNLHRDHAIRGMARGFASDEQEQ
jgi:DNA-binding GntR family transcriptional regulator